MPTGVYIRKPMTAKHRAAISKGSMGKVLTAKHRANCSKAHKGLVPTAEHRAAVSKGLTGRTIPAELAARLGAHLKAANMGHTRTVGIKNQNVKLTEQQVREIYHRAWNQESQKFLAEVFGVSTSNISAIKRGCSWSHLKLKRPIN